MPLDDPSVTRSGSERAALKQAQDARLRRAAWAVAGAVLGGFGLLSLAVALFVLGVASPGVGPAVALLLTVAVPLGLSAFAFFKARRAGRELASSVESAWQSVAAEVLVQRGEELTPARLAELMRTDEAHAERLLALLSADDRVRTRVTDAGDLVYSSRMRVDDSGAELVERDAEEKPAEAERPSQ